MRPELSKVLALTLAISRTIMWRLMAHSRTYYPKLTRAFPFGDPLAKLAARALVLYGDLLVEWPGIGREDGFKLLEKAGPLYRHLYFFRASCVTLQSCSHLLNQLMANPSFKEWLASDGDSGQNFTKAKKEFARHSSIIARLRNTVGAHAEHDIGDAIGRFDSDEVGSIEIHSDDLLRPHLASRILINTILKDCPQERERAEFEKIVEDINAATKAMINALTEFLSMYGRRYPLFGG